MIGSEDQYDGGWIALGGKRRRNGDGQGRIAAHRLKHNVGFDTAFAQLLGDDEAKIGIGDDDRPAESCAIGDASNDLLKGRLISDQGHELFGHAFARNRPEARTGATAHDHWSN